MMKKLLFVSLIMAAAMFIGSCSALQKNDKSKDKPAAEQSESLEEDYFED